MKRIFLLLACLSLLFVLMPAVADTPAFKAEERAASLWGLLTDDPVFRKAGRERTQKFIVV